MEYVTGVIAIMAAAALFMSMFGLKVFFGYPKIIRKDAGTILRKLYKERRTVPFLYYLFGVAGLLLVYLFVLMGKSLESANEVLFSEMGKVSGIIYGVLLFAGITRYTALFPELAKQYVEKKDEQKLQERLFETFNCYIGNTVTEHVAFVFLAAAELFFSIGYMQTTILPIWVNIFGMITAIGLVIGNLEFLGFKKVFVVNRIFSAISGIWILLVGIFYL